MSGEDTNRSTPRRDHILGAATELFLAQGFAATSMADVAEAAGIRKPSLYHHFAGKDELFLATVEAGHSDELDRLRELAASGLDHAEKLDRAIDVVYAAIVLSTAGRLVPVIAETGRLFPAIARSFHERFVVEMHDAVMGIVRDGTEAGAFAFVDPDGIESLIFAPPVELALARAMFTEVEGAAERHDVARVREGHKSAIRQLLLGRPAA